jgi:hypothetical protein
MKAFNSVVLAVLATATLSMANPVNLETRVTHAICISHTHAGGGLLGKKFGCRNSKCSDKNVTDHIKVNIAADENGIYVAKCPINLLDFEWEWPEGKKSPWE